MSISLPNTLVIGGANLDVTGNCEHRLKPGDSNPGHVNYIAGGVGRNIAENLARLALPTSIISMVGNDFGRQLILQTCDAAGLNTDNIITEPDHATGTYLAINNEMGSLLAAIADMSIIDRLTPERLNEKQSAIDSADQIVIEANLSEGSINWLANAAHGKAIHADAVSATKAPRLRQLLPQLTTLKVNRGEASAILGQPGDDLALAKQLFEMGVDQVLLSQGAQGAMVLNQSGIIHRPAIKAENKSDTGAGDALFAGFIAAQHLFQETTHQLDFAIACATLTLSCSKSVNPELTKAYLREHFLPHLPEGAWIA